MHVATTLPIIHVLCESSVDRLRLGTFGRLCAYVCLTNFVANKLNHKNYPFRCQSNFGNTAHRIGLDRPTDRTTEQVNGRPPHRTSTFNYARMIRKIVFINEHVQTNLRLWANITFYPKRKKITKETLATCDVLWCVRVTFDNLMRLPLLLPLLLLLSMWPLHAFCTRHVKMVTLHTRHGHEHGRQFNNAWFCQLNINSVVSYSIFTTSNGP